MKAAYMTTAGDAARDCGGRLVTGEPGIVIDSVSSDSRDSGSRALFVPLAGERFDGHQFIPGLLNGRSIAAFITAREGFTEGARAAGIAEIRCGDTLSALGSLAARHRDIIDPTVIGVTGTNGKTTTKELLHRVLSPHWSCLKSEKNYNNEIGVPFTLLGLSEGHRMAVIEMGMNHPGEIARLAAIAKPDLAVITSVGEGHLEFLGSVENVARAKAEIFTGMRAGSTAVLNRDTACFEIVAGAAADSGMTVLTFGRGEDAQVRPSAYRLGPGWCEVDIGGVTVSVPVYGIHNVYNILAVVAVALHFGMTTRQVADSLQDFELVGGRGHFIEHGFLVIDDTYNANPLSVRAAIQSAAEVFTGRRKIAILGDMKELGAAAADLHAETGRAAAQGGFEYLLAVGEHAADYVDGARAGGMESGRALCFADKGALTELARALVHDDDIVLVKGSRSMKMEEIVRSLTADGE